MTAKAICKAAAVDQFLSRTMSSFVKAALLCLLGAQTVYSTALDDYVWKPDSNYGWVDMVRATLVWIFN